MTTLRPLRPFVARFLLPMILLAGCAPEQRVFDGAATVEFDRATNTAAAPGLSYPLLSVVRGTGLLRLRVNLVGRPRNGDETIRFAVDAAASTAVLDRHYRLPEGTTFVIPAGSLTGVCTVEVPFFTPTPAPLTLVLLLEGNASLPANPNYQRVGFTIRSE